MGEYIKAPKSFTSEDITFAKSWIFFKKIQDLAPNVNCLKTLKLANF